MIPRISTPACTLIPFTRTHAHNPRYATWLRDRDVLLTLNLPQYLIAPVEDSVLEAYCESMMAERDVWFYALETRPHGDFVGTLKVKFDRQPQRADLGIMIGEKRQWGKGLASAALGAVAHYLFESEPVCKLTAGAMATNPAMIRVFEKLGFQQEGVFRQHDLIEGNRIDHVHLGCFADELERSGT